MKRIPFSITSPATIMGAVFFTGLIIRLIYLVNFRQSPFCDNLLLDAQWHDEWAWDWANGAWKLGGRSFFRAPLYPFWLSLIYRVFGHNLMAVRIVQAILGASTTAALTGAGWRIGGRGAALWTAAIGLLYGPLLYFDTELLIPNLLIALLTWSLFYLLAPPSLGAYSMAALLFGLATIARPTALVLLPAILVFIWIQTRSHTHLRKRLVVWIAMVALIPSVIITLINAKEERTFVYVASQGGVNFYAGNHKLASGRSVEIPELDLQGGWGDFVAASQRIAEEDRGKPLNSREVSAYWTRKGWNWITTAPLDALVLTLKKIYYLLNSYEVPNNRDMYSDRSFPLNLLLWKIPWFAFPWGLIFPLAVVGAVLGLRSPKLRTIIGFLSIWIFLYGIFLVPFFITARFRMGMVPPMILLAAFALFQGRNILKVYPLALGVTALILVNSSFFQARYDNPAQELVKRGMAFMAAERIDEGRTILKEAFEMQPKSARIAYLLGWTYLMKGSREEGLRMIRHSINLVTTESGLLYYMGRFLLHMEYYTEAVAALEKAITLRPNGTGWADLGIAYESIGQEEKAIEAYQRSIQLAPNDPRGYLNLGSLYQKQQKLNLSISTFRQGADVIPNSFPMHFNLALAYVESGQLLSGLEEITTALRIKPNDPQASNLYHSLRQELRRIEMKSRP